MEIFSMTTNKAVMRIVRVVLLMQKFFFDIKGDLQRGG